jgi:hypothetical protein
VGHNTEWPDSHSRAAGVFVQPHTWTESLQLLDSLQATNPHISQRLRDDLAMLDRIVAKTRLERTDMARNANTDLAKLAL